MMMETSNSNANSEETIKTKSKPSSFFAKSLFSIFEKMSRIPRTVVALIRSRHSPRVHMLGRHQAEQHYLLDYYSRGDAEEEDNINESPDLTHSLFEEEFEEEEDDMNESVIDIVKNERAGEGNGEDGEFKLEDEIDRVADLFISKFHKQLRIQKANSFKRIQEMLNRSV